MLFVVCKKTLDFILRRKSILKLQNIFKLYLSLKSLTFFSFRHNLDKIAIFYFCPLQLNHYILYLTVDICCSTFIYCELLVVATLYASWRNLFVSVHLHMESIELVFNFYTHTFISNMLRLTCTFVVCSGSKLYITRNKIGETVTLSTEIET